MEYSIERNEYKDIRNWFILKLNFVKFVIFGYENVKKFRLKIRETKYRSATFSTVTQSCKDQIGGAQNKNSNVFDQMQYKQQMFFESRKTNYQNREKQKSLKVFNL